MAVISRITLKEDQRIQQLLQRIELGNKKPSELLREKRRPGGATFGDDQILRELRLQRLPPRLPSLLSFARKYSLEKTSKIAEGSMLIEIDDEIGPASVAACAVAPHPSDPSCQPRKVVVSTIIALEA